MDESGDEARTVARIAALLRAAGCVFAEDEARILLAAAAQAGPGDADSVLTAMTRRRAAGMPLEHVVGWAEFCGLRIAVDPGVFVPRRRTEFLIGQAEAAVRGRSELVVADLCCGSGALGVALTASLRQSGTMVELHAADSDPAALPCARRNVLPAAGQVYEGDLFAAFPDKLRGHIDVLLANVPYVPSAEIALLPAEARDHEPRTALDGGPDGLDVLRRVLTGARTWLAPGGIALTEVSDRQSGAALAAATAAGLDAHLATDPDLGATVLLTARPR